MVRKALSQLEQEQRRLAALMELPTGKDATGKESKPANRARKRR